MPKLIYFAGLIAVLAVGRAGSGDPTTADIRSYSSSIDVAEAVGVSVEGGDQAATH